MNSWHDWHKILFGVICGVSAAGLLIILTRQPQGDSIELSPLPTEEPINVFVVGAVAFPGVYQLPAGSRAQQAVEAAGGLTSTADIETINLAVQLADGAKILVPEKGDISIVPDKAGEISGILININTATINELMLLPGIGEDKADLIVHYREENGMFKTIEEIQNVKGIGPATFEKLRQLITVAP
jgi:competence protein ComEA